MNLLDRLPPELICYVLSCLPVQDLSALRRTSRTWNRFFVENENSVYHRAAALHGFASSINTTLEEVLREEPRHVAGVDNWRTLCKQRFLMESNWTKTGTCPLTVLAEDHADVHRIKIDEDVGIMLTTHADGGLVVRDVDTGDVLWGLPRTYVRSYAHCEYGNGFMIFDRLGQAKEVWRLASEYDRSPLPADEFQQEISFTINQYIPKTKGSFKPWALLTMPEFGRAFRFVYPTLLVAGLNKAYLYDIESGHLIQTIEDTQAPRNEVSLGDINYVELSPLHVLICGRMQLRLFERGTGTLLYHIPPKLDDLISVHVALDEIAHIGDISAGCASLVPTSLHRLQPVPRLSDEFIAVHVSPDGTTVVALTRDSRLLIIKDIVKVIKREEALCDSAVEIYLTCPKHADALVTSPGVYLAFEHGRVGVITISGVFIVTLDASRHGLVDPWTEAHNPAQNASDSPLRGSAFPYMRIYRVLPFDFQPYLEHVSCLQMTRTRMAFTWHPDIGPFVTNPTEHEDTQHLHVTQIDNGVGGQQAEAVQTGNITFPAGDAGEGGDEQQDIVLILDDQDDFGLDEGEAEEDEDAFHMNLPAGEAWDDDHDEVYTKAIVCLNFAPAEHVADP